MAFTLPNLPYAIDALAPHLSKETLEFHHGKHHAAYVNVLNEVSKGTKYETMNLADIVKAAEPGRLFNQAGQHYNHSFYWTSMKPQGGGSPSGKLATAISQAFGDFDAFKKKFQEAAVGHFGSGWAWLVQNSDGSLAVDSTHDAGCPLTQGKTPIITCDLWEHAYYIDYRNLRAKYVETFLNHLVNWEFGAANLR
jgi:superoxide dismutase, Fe-Mn family